MSQVPAATRTLRVLRYLASRPEPVSAGADHAGLRPAPEHGVPPAGRDGRGGLRGPPGGRGALRARASRPTRSAAATPGRRRWRGSPGARSPTSSTRPARTPTSRCSTGSDVLYVIEERAAGRPTLVTDVGVRLPAHLTASGRAMLAALPAAQVRALYPDRESFMRRHGTGPATPSALRAVLTETRQRGHATEDGEVTPGLRQRRGGGARPHRVPGGRRGGHGGGARDLARAVRRRRTPHRSPADPAPGRGLDRVT